MINNQQNSRLKIESFPVGQLQCNCSIVWDDSSKTGVVIDPGDEAEKILSKVNKLGVEVKYLLHTHAHLDHIGATFQVSQSLNDIYKRQVPIVLHQDDIFLYEMLAKQAEMLGISVDERNRVDHNLLDEELFAIGENYKLQSIFTPGHTPGSACFCIKGHDESGTEEQILFSGDTLFQGSIGRTDLWGGDLTKIEKSIKGRLYSLDDDTRVICGHGADTIIGVEKRSNQFIRA